MIIHLLHRLIRVRFHRLGFHSQFLKLDSCQVHFFQKDNRDASMNILFIHGLGTSSSTWINVLPGVREFGNISCLDLPGYGFSKITSGDPCFSLQQLDHAIEHFIQSSQRLPIVLIGHSLGGWLAARYAAKHPESVRHLILINNAGIKYDGFEQQGDAFSLKSVDDVHRLLQKMWFHYPWYFKPFTSSVYDSLRKKHISRFVQSIREEDLLNQSFSCLTMPIDVIWGEDDGLISKKSVDIMKQHAPHLKVHFILRCGHVPQLERPRELTSMLKTILTASKQSPR
jgi:pimeloyl-ACP methyl ester carboxylesterase